MVSPVTNQMENGLSKLFDLWGQTIDTSEQAVFNLKHSGLHDEEGKKINTSDPLTAVQKRSGRFLSLMMTVHPYLAEQNCKHSRMTCRSCVQLLIDVDGIDASINTQIMKTLHDLLLHLAALDNGRNLDIGTLNQEKGYIFSEYCTESLKEN